jgi:hypothetical protein
MSESLTITDDEVFEKFLLLFPKTKPKKVTVLSQDDIDKFNKVWKKEFKSKRGRYKKEFFDLKKETDYKNCLFSIFSRHWDEPDGFQINMKITGEHIGKSFVTVSRMIQVFIKSGLLSRCHNYMVGKQTYFYHKNSVLFNHIFTGISNEYYDWILNNKINNTKIKSNNNNKYSNVFMSTNQVTVEEKKKRGRKPKMYIPNHDLLLKIEKEYLPIIDKLNKKQHEQLKINLGLRFNSRGNYSGRSSSFFCYTLNEKKKNYDTTMMTRSKFLNEMGLSNYKQVYDIKSEVPRTTILCNTGIWKPESFDFYSEVKKETDPLEVTRDRLKEFYMRFNFDTGSDKELFNHFKRSRVFYLKHENGLTFKESYKLYDIRYDNGVEYTFDEWKYLGSVIKNIQGKSWGNLIFWWTSLIQIKTIYTVLKETGIRIYNVYDGFYSPPEIKKDYLVKVVKQSSEYIYNKYIKKTPYPY